MISLQEERLLKKIILRDTRALALFYKKHKDSLLNFIIRMVQDQRDAEEVLQDSFVAFFESLRSFRKQSSLKTYLFSIAKRKSIDKLRRKKIKRILFSYFPENVVEGFKTVLLDDELNTRELSKKIHTTLSNLPYNYSYVIRLKYVEGYHVRDIAEKMDMKYKATESLIFRARKAFIQLYGKIYD